MRFQVYEYTCMCVQNNKHTLERHIMNLLNMKSAFWFQVQLTDKDDNTLQSAIQEEVFFYKFTSRSLQQV